MNMKDEIQTASKDRFIRRVYRIFFVFIIIGMILAFLLVYQPMKTELEKSLINNFAQLALSDFHSFENSLQRGIEGAKSLSSRTMIKNAIVDYKSGKLDLEELKAFTKPKFADGAMALEYLITADRIVDGVVVAQYNADGAAHEDYIKEIEKEPGPGEAIKIEASGKKVYAVITSPIMNGSEPIGVDILVYDLEKQVHMFCTETIDAVILDQNDYLKLEAQAETLDKAGETELLKERGSIYAVSPVGDSKYFVSKQPLSTLFKPIDQLAKRIAVGSLVTFAGFAVLAYIYIIRYAKKELVKLESSRNQYKQIAYKDHLTGAYNRQFLDIWNQSIRSHEHEYAIVMIDVDDFKNINDIYGHLIGDQVLKTIGETIIKSIRQSDFLIRYGGDEFVLILSETTAEMAEKMIGRIQEQLNLFDPARIHFSYGVSLLAGQNDFEDLLKQADKKMYDFKFKNKTE